MGSGEGPGAGAGAGPEALSWAAAGSEVWFSSMQYSMRLLINSAWGERGLPEAGGWAVAPAHLPTPAAAGRDEPAPQSPALCWGRQVTKQTPFIPDRKEGCSVGRGRGGIPVGVTSEVGGGWERRDIAVRRRRRDGEEGRLRTTAREAGARSLGRGGAHTSLSDAFSDGMHVDIGDVTKNQWAWPGQEMIGAAGLAEPRTESCQQVASLGQLVFMRCPPGSMGPGGHMPALCPPEGNPLQSRVRDEGAAGAGPQPWTAGPTQPTLRRAHRRAHVCLLFSRRDPSKLRGRAEGTGRAAGTTGKPSEFLEPRPTPPRFREAVSNLSLIWQH